MQIIVPKQMFAYEPLVLRKSAQLVHLWQISILGNWTFAPFYRKITKR